MTARSTVFLRSVLTNGLESTVRELMEACRWQTHVSRDALVVVKPNLCMSVTAKVVGANTDAAITAAVCKVLLGRTRRVLIGESDHLRQAADQGFGASGYVEMARALGVGLVNLSREPRTKIRLDPVEVEMPRLLLDCDAFITLPVLKTHALTYFTGALKNQWGCVPQHDRILLHRYLDPLLPALHRLLRPRIALMDAIVGMEGRGPTNGKPRRLDLLLASEDGVALDVTAMRLVGLDPARSRHLVLAGQQGLGRVHASDIEVNGDWAAHATHFEPPVLDAAVAAMNYMSRYRWFVRHVLQRDSVFYPGRAVVQRLRRARVIAGS